MYVVICIIVNRVIKLQLLCDVMFLWCYQGSATLVGVLGRWLPKCLLELDISTNSYNWIGNLFTFLFKKKKAKGALGIFESTTVLDANLKKK